MRVYDNRVTNQKSDIATVTITVIPLLGPPGFISDEYTVTIPITTPIGSGIFNQIAATDNDLQVWFPISHYTIANKDFVSGQSPSLDEPRREKSGLWGFLPGPTLIGLCIHRRWLEAEILGYRR